MSRRLTISEFIEKSNKYHHNKYDYELVDYKNKNSKVQIICPKHGLFSQVAGNHMTGSGCPKCKNSIKMDTTIFIERAVNKHGCKYNYSKVNYINPKSKVQIICPIHGSFFQRPTNHLSGRGCNKCANSTISVKLKKDENEALNNIPDLIKNKYNYSLSEYKGSNSKIKIICPEHGIFKQNYNNHVKGHIGCKKCNNMGTSKMEKEIAKFVKELNINIEENNTEILNGKELDIYIPELKIAIEFNGLYWHSDLFKDKNYHLNKLEECNSKGIRLIQIFEDEWLNKPEIVKSRLRNILGKIENKIYARNCIIKEIDSKSVTKFLNENHLQGTVGSKVKLGLFHKDELVSLMTFGNLRKNLGQKAGDNVFELLRFCNKLNTSIIGGASKLFKYFYSNYNPISIISYADRRWGNGELYYNLGFNHIHNSQPNYFYVKKDGELKREARFKYRKDILVSEGFDKNKTEKKIMIERGYFRIYDCGAMKFSFDNKKSSPN
ncbi:MAG: hypothetical protein LBM02_09990 [Lachnospiraceae bacterium]|jgi:hypothetical protein|nr:hypothetical protein [Lachnospiraceae bacterium]